MAEIAISHLEIEDPQGGPSFRHYVSKDLERCAQISASAWAGLFSFAGKEGEINLMRFSVDFYAATATWLEVACISGEVVGLLFGKIESDLPRFAGMRTFLTDSRTYLKLLLGRFGKIPKRMKIMRLATADDRKIRNNSPEAEGEVTFLVVDEAFRRRGMGRQLMDRFVAYARSKNVKKITVNTTDPICNWEFYEQYGFRRCGAFVDGLSSYALKREVKISILELDL
jgi:ribosomal protein S18 acetylase RimI-like enzyme